MLSVWDEEPTGRCVEGDDRVEAHTIREDLQNSDALLGINRLLEQGAVRADIRQDNVTPFLYETRLLPGRVEAASGSINHEAAASFALLHRNAHGQLV